MKTSLEIAQVLANRVYPLPPKDLQEFASIIEPATAAKGEIILKERQVSRYILYLESGLLRQFYYKDGRDITEHFSSEGNQLVCIISTFKKQPTELMVEALEDSVYHRISYSGLENLMRTSLPINHLYQKFLEYDLIISQEKADSWRFETAKVRYDRFRREYPEAARRASLIHIASYLLMTPETLSRVRAGAL